MPLLRSGINTRSLAEWKIKDIIVIPHITIIWFKTVRILPNYADTVKKAAPFYGTCLAGLSTAFCLNRLQWRDIVQWSIKKQNARTASSPQRFDFALMLFFANPFYSCIYKKRMPWFGGNVSYLLNFFVNKLPIKIHRKKCNANTTRYSKNVTNYVFFRCPLSYTLGLYT